MTEVIINEIVGNCPVQADGMIDGHEFYFRARGQRWGIWIATGRALDILDPGNWFYEEAYGTEPFAAGWMEESEARAFIEQAAVRWRAGDQT